MIFNDLFQKRIIKALLYDADFYSYFHNILEPRFFENDYAEKLVDLILKHLEKFKEKPDNTSLLQDIDLIDSGIDKKELKNYYKEVCDSDLLNLEHLKEGVLKFCQSQSFKEFVLECADSIENKDVSLSQLSVMRKKMDDVINIGSRLTNIGHFFFELESIEERIKNRLEGTRRGAISTGISYLDYILDGGICKQELAVILAPSGRGKSISLVHLGKAAIQSGANVFHYTLEMSEMAISNRYDASFLGEFYNRLNEYSDAIREKLTNIVDKYKKHLIVKHLSYESSNVIDILNHIQLVKKSKGIQPDVVIIDYGDVMTPAYNKGIKEVRHQHTQIFKELKFILACEKDIPVITASQTNRQAVNKTIVRNEDIGESFAKVQIADIVLALCQTEEEANEEIPKARLYQSKMRDAEDGRTVYLLMEKSKMSIKWDSESQAINDPKGYNFYLDYISKKKHKETMKQISKFRGRNL